MERILASETVNKVGEKVLVSGWVATIRDHGQLIFIDLRDWSGRVQLVINPEKKELFETAKTLGNEYVISVEGTVMARDGELSNDKIETGSIEIEAETLEVLNTSKPIPFPIDTDGHEIDENTRFKYRYVDLRRDRLKSHMKKKHNFLLAVRKWFDENGFTEVTTPLLTSTSPEGARDFYVPSRLHQGKFFVLPQAPQQYKQLLMVGGVDKYFQIAPCARDEDPRADRHAGVFYQIDIEMSFPTIDKIFATAENMLQKTCPVVAPEKKIKEFPFPRLGFEESMDRYGTDKPDLRFELELKDVTEEIKGKTELSIFNNAEKVKCLVAEGCGDWSRKQIEELEKKAKEFGAKGLAYAKVTSEGLESGVSKFFGDFAAEFVKIIDAKEGDLVFFVADTRAIANRVLGFVRSELGDILELKDPNVLAYAWIQDFPFFEQDPETGELEMGHNPFSMPIGGMEALESDDLASIKTYQYDLALNGFEMMSGSIRNHNPDILLKVFELVGYGKEEVLKKFGGMYNAFQYGAPPHGGWAIGFDRLFMVLIDEPNIRDTYAFPKNSNGMDVMMDAPNEAPQADLDVLGIEHKLKGTKVMNEIRGILDTAEVKYEIMEHVPVRTSEEAAKVRGTKVADGAKALVLKSTEYDMKYFMVVIPANRQLDLVKASENIGEKLVVVKSEEVESRFGILVGGVPPFGRLLGMDLYFDESMYSKEFSVFNCGRKDRSIQLATKDLIKAAQPDRNSESMDFLA